MKKALRIFFIISLCVGATVSYANPPVSKGKAASSPVQKTASQKKSISSVSLSFSLFQKLMNMKPSAVTQYLKQQGCKIEQGGEGLYEVRLKNGGITIYYPSYHSPRRGIGPVEFYTYDRNVCQQWIKSLRNADYTYFRDDIWVGDNAHKPEFGVMNNIGNKMDGADYSGTATLFLSAYPM